MQLTGLFCYKGNLPAPQQVYYNDSSEIISWSPPTNKVIIHGISNDFRITHYNIYVTDTQTEITHIGSATDMAYFVGNLTVSCNFSIQVSAVNPSDEGLLSSRIIVDCKSSHIK